jgi:peptidoglycan/xylan/chitin deacetylase (PgdA/CDA1 family)
MPQRPDSLLDVPQVRDWMGSRLLMNVDTEERLVALTFDDGPSPRNTPPLLDLLGRLGVPATFFVLGRYARTRGDLVRRAVAEGHEVGNHGTWHVPLPLLPSALVRREVRTTGELLARILGHPPRYYRPALGWFNGRILELLREEGYRPVIGDVYPVDSKKPGTERIVERVLTRTRPGSIIILHDGGWRARSDRRQTLAAVEGIVTALRDRGYGFRTLTGLETGDAGLTRGTGSPAARDRGA